MPKFVPLFSVWFLLVFISCSGVAQPDKQQPAVTRSEFCRTDKDNSYELYIPAHLASERLPLLLIVDAHGAGTFALEKFKLAAQKYRLILVASNRIKNGSRDFEASLGEVISDVRQRFPVGKTLFLSGFSGGARMVLAYAQANQTDGLVLCGALASRQELIALKCLVVSLSGMGDFNFAETAQYLFDEELKPGNLKIMLTSGSHSWPEEGELEDAVGFLALSANKDAGVSPDLLSTYIPHQQANVDSLRDAGNYVQAVQITRTMSSVKELDPHKWFARNQSLLQADTHFAAQLRDLANSLNKEMQARQSYIEAFSSKDLTWWSREIDTVEHSLRTPGDSLNTAMYQRIKGFLGIACYSLCRQAVEQQNAGLLGKILEIYRRLEPHNADMCYFSAFIPYWKADNVAAREALNKAKGEGYSDLLQMNRDFPGIVGN